MAFDRCDQRRFLTAYECAGSEPQFQVEAEIGPEDVHAEQSVFLGLFYCYLKPLYGNWILSPDIYISLVGPDGISCDRHGLDYAVGVALQYTSVHERAGVAFVGIAEHVFFIAFRLPGQFPLEACGEPCAASAPEAGLLDLFDDLFGGHFRQCLRQRLISVKSYIFVDILRVDDTTVPEGHPDLAREEIDTIERLRRVVGVLVACHEPFYRSSLYEVFIDDLFNVFNLYHCVHYAFRVYDNDGAFGTEAEAAGDDDLYFLVQVIFI